MQYEDFIKTKLTTEIPTGIESPKPINPKLFNYQQDIVTWALKRGRAAIFSACGTGKGQPCGSKVLTPKGWVEIQNIKVGDRIISSDGTSSVIQGVYPKSEIDTYRIYFNDKTSFVVDKDHLHIVRNPNDKAKGHPWRVMSTLELLETPLKYGTTGQSRTWEIPLVKPVHFDSQELEIHPYILGALIGDGCLRTSVTISNPDTEIIEKIQSILGNGYSCNQSNHDAIEYSITFKDKNKNPLTQSLKKLDLMGKYSYEKHIPQEYLINSIENRVELLRGLMDTDGYIDTTNQFYTTSEKLADDFMFLTQSLGFTPTKQIKTKPTYTHNNELRHGRDCYVITFGVKDINPCFLSRKAEKVNLNPRGFGRWIDKIEFESKQKTVCISVDSKDSSYVTENFIVTHNTVMQLEWAKHVYGHTGRDVLILAPLAVTQQTIEEGAKFDIEVNSARKQSDIKPGLNITNYEMLHNFDCSHFSGVVLDESSILKSYTGKYRNDIIEGFARTAFKLACTATPSPNDFMELGNHTEFLGIMSRVEMLATYFVHDGGETSKWRLKGHAASEFWKWMATWCVMVEKPSDLGYSDDGFILPPLNHHQIVVKSPPSPGALFAFEAKTLTERRQARKDSLNQRVNAAVELVKQAPDDNWLIWCDLNIESEMLTKAIPGAVEVKGSDKPEIKEKNLLGFGKDFKILTSKPKIAAFGMNYQHTNKMIFVGLSDSFEAYYQAVRRCWRFGQTKPVDVYVITSEAEGAVVKNIEEKESKANQMIEEIIKNMKDEMNREVHNAVIKQADDYKTGHNKGDSWELYMGDCVEGVKQLPDNSIHYSVFSPPFASLYTYSNSARDMGNCSGDQEFYDHFKFLVSELHRVIKPGRLVSFHCMNLPTSKQNHGFIGIRDFRGELIRMFEDAGFIYHSEVCIWKDPVIAMQRTKALGLLHKQLKKDSAMSRQGIPDYLVTMRKHGDNPEPVSHTAEDFPVHVWQQYASPIWMDINPSDTLQYRSAREHKDEKHICPLQLEVIRRALKLWTNPGDLVLTPFAGIGSELVVSLEEGRRAVGFELKESYYKQAVKNCQRAEKDKGQQLDLFGMAVTADA